MNYHAHLVRSIYIVQRNKKHLQAYKGNKVHSYYYKKLKNDNEIDIKQAYLGHVIKTLHQSLKVTWCLCKNKKLVPNIS